MSRGGQTRKVERNALIVRLHEQGMSGRAIAVKFGITFQRVYQILDAATPWANLTPEQDAEREQRIEQHRRRVEQDCKS